MTSSKDNPVPRPAARVLLIDSRDRILMFRVTLPHQKDIRLWITPGGGLDPNETYEQAALRELWEETGLTNVELGPLIWTRRHTWKWDQTWIDTFEKFYLLRTSEFPVVPAAYDPIEKEYMHEHRWWSLSELADAMHTETFVPTRLHELLPPILAGDIPTTPIDTGP